MSGNIDNDTSCSACQIQPESWFEVTASNGECVGTTFEFDLEVEAWISPGCSIPANVTDLSGGSLTLNNGEIFPSSGDGYIIDDNGITDFSWSGKTGDHTLDGTGLSSVANGSQCSFYPQIDTGYSCTPSITVSVAKKSPDDSEVTVSPTQVSSWTQGKSTTEMEVTNNPFEEDISIEITVEETAENSTGKSGSDNITLIPCYPSECNYDCSPEYAWNATRDDLEAAKLAAYNACLAAGPDKCDSVNKDYCNCIFPPTEDCDDLGGSWKCYSGVCCSFRS